MIRHEQVTVRKGAFALHDLDLEIPAGSYAVLMGRTGTGKTTLLEALCGLAPVQSGRITLAQRDVTRSRPASRNVGYVPQDGALFPAMSVRENLAFALRIRRCTTSEITRRVHSLADLLGLGALLDRSVRGLSGGEAQRVSLGRALAFAPPVLLLDEPLSALDDETREQMWGLLRSVHRRTGVTVLHVTHNVEDARQLAEHRVVLRDGKLQHDPAHPAR